MRNPRMNPRPGDIVSPRKAKYYPRSVVYVTEGLVIYDDLQPKTLCFIPGDQKQCTRTTWQEWAFGGRVERYAESGAFCPLNCSAPLPALHQTTRLANRALSALRRDPDYRRLADSLGGTPMELSCRVLFEMGLEAALTSEGRFLRRLMTAAEEEMARRKCIT